jgi:hypothetical protein
MINIQRSLFMGFIRLEMSVRVLGFRSRRGHVHGDKYVNALTLKWMFVGVFGPKKEIVMYDRHVSTILSKPMPFAISTRMVFELRLEFEHEVIGSCNNGCSQISVSLL